MYNNHNKVQNDHKKNTNCLKIATKTQRTPRKRCKHIQRDNTQRETNNYTES